MKEPEEKKTYNLENADIATNERNGQGAGHLLTNGDKTKYANFQRAKCKSPPNRKDKYLYKGHALTLIQAYNASVQLLYPQFDWYVFPGFLTYALYLHYLKHFKHKYRLEPIPNKLYHRLIQKDLIQCEHTVFVPEETYYEYVEAGAEELNFVYLVITGATGQSLDKIKSTVVDKELIRSTAESEQVLREILNHSPRRIMVRMKPTLNCPRNCVFVQENLYANLLDCFGPSNDPQLSSTRYWIHMEKLGTDDDIPSLATKAHVHLLNPPYDMPTELSDLILANYFDKPRLLHRGHTYRIELNRELLTSPKYAYYFLIFAELTHIFFRCVLLEVNSSKKEPQAVVVRNQTELLQIPYKFQFLPRQTLDPLSITSNYPGGLRTAYEQLRASIDAFISRKSACCLSSKQVHPVFLLKGPRGSGKKRLATAVAQELGFHIYHDDMSEIVTQIHSQTEAKLKAIFARSQTTQPLIICLRNFDLYGVDHEGKVDPRLYSFIVEELNGLYRIDRKYAVIFLGLTSEKKLKPMIQRLFLDTIHVDYPNKEQRYEMLRWLHTRELYKQKIFNMKELHLLPLYSVDKQEEYLKKLCMNWPQTKEALRQVADKTHGFLLSDLKMLHEKTVADLYSKGNCCMALKFKHFEKVFKVMQKSMADSFGAAKVPTVHWEDIGGLAKIKDEIQSSFGLPLKHMHLMGEGFRRSGILLYGPPGTGKTLVAKAVATECNLCFLSVQGPELLNMYVGQSEKNVREVFERARAAAPCVIFLDELDSLAPNRGVAGDSGGVMDRVVSQLLAEMDSIGDVAKPVFILAATNRPDLIDPALLRPGRFDKMFYVGPCACTEDKLSVLRAQTKRFHFAKDFNIEEFAGSLHGEMSGADLYSICSNAWMAAVRRCIERRRTGEASKEELKAENVIVGRQDFEKGRKQFVPSISRKDLEYYKKIKDNFDVV